MIYLSIGMAAIGMGFVGLGLAYFFAKFVEGIARNPGAAEQLKTYFYIPFALIETIAIYIFVLAMLVYIKA